MWKRDETRGRRREPNRMVTRMGVVGAMKGDKRQGFLPLSYIDDGNSTRIDRAEVMDEVLDQVIGEYRMKWDRGKD